MRAGAALVVALLATGSASAGQNPGLPPSGSAPSDAVLAIGDSTERMTVPVTIGQGGPYPFIVDTGSQRTVISRELAATLGLARGPDVRMTAMTETSNVGTVMIPALRVSNIVSRPIAAPSMFSANLDAPGLLGLDVLADHAVSIDFEANRMTLRSSAKRGRHKDPDADPNDIVVRGRNVFGQLIVTQAYYRGRRISVVIDTGSTVSLGNSALRARMRNELKTPRQIELISVTGGRMSADYTQAKQLDIAGIGFENLPIAFVDVEPFRRLGLSDVPALMLGMDALRLFRHVDVDFANREVRFARPRAASRAAE